MGAVVLGAVAVVPPLDVVILVPIIFLVGRRTGVSLMKIGISALSGLSILHGLVPPHPGPVTAIVLLAGRGHDHRPAACGASGAEDTAAEERRGFAGDAAVDPASPEAAASHPPSFWAAVATMVLPVALMLAKAIGELTSTENSQSRNILDFLGTPAVALLAGVPVARFALGRGSGMPRDKIHQSLGSGLPGVAGIMLIGAAGGGFKQVPSDSGVAQVIANYAHGSALSPAAGLVAGVIRLATGSAAVAPVTTVGIIGGVASTLDRPHLALLVLAVGAGSLVFSHVNDAGFWLVKEYFGLSVWQTIKSWSVMETAISVMALICVLIIAAFV